MSTTVRATDAAVALNGRTVWEGVNVDVKDGEFVALLGPNGAGKSTFIRTLLGIQRLSAGRIEVLGASPGRNNSRIGYLPQRRSFDPSLRVRGIDVVRLGLDGDRWGIPLPGIGPWRGRRRRDNGRVEEVLELVGASGYARRPIGMVSGGEQQRLLIAQALVRRPDVLLLDEPLDSLDLPNQAGVATLLATICREQGVTVMLVAHDVNPILRHLDGVIYLGHGVAVSGKPSEVITAATLSSLYGTSIEVLRTSDGRLVVVGEPDAPAVHSDRHAH